MTHAEQRLLAREPALASDPTLLSRLQQLASDGRSHAVRLTSPTRTNRGNHNTSSGNTVWAILRSGRVVTVMRRRTNQPSTPAAFDTDCVHFSLASACAACNS